MLDRNHRQILFSNWLPTRLVLLLLMTSTCLNFLRGQVDSTALAIPDSLMIAGHDWGYLRSLPQLRTSASTSVGENQLSATTIDQKLRGLVPGLTSIQNSGQPGSALTLQMRGVRSFAAGTQPLFVIDGFPIYNNNAVTFSGLVNGPALNGLIFFDPADVASIEVLRGAGASSLYGSRGANGIILIKTKQAEKGESTLELSTEIGVQQPIGRYDLASGSEFADFKNRAHINAGQNAPYPGGSIGGTDWQEQLFQSQPITQQHRFAFRAGGPKVQFLLSGGFHRTDGLAQGSDLDRYNLRANINADISERVTLTNALNFGRVSASTLASDQSASQGQQGVFLSAWRFNPLLPARNSAGALIPFNFEVDGNNDVTKTLLGGEPITNPLALAALWESELTTSRITDFLKICYQLAPDFTLSAGVGIDAIYNDETTFLPGNLIHDTPQGAIGAVAKMQSHQWMQQYMLSYQKSLLNENHSISALLGYTAEGYQRELLGGRSEGFENETLGFYNLSVGKNKTVASNYSQWSLQSLIGNLSYIYRNKLTVELAVRADASSRFGNNYEVFSSISGAYTWSSDTDNAFSWASVRLAVGESGNQEITPYAGFTALDELGVAFNGGTLNGIRPARIGNADLEMERTRQYNAGLSLSFWQGRMSLDVDVYRDQTDNAIIFASLPATSGFAQSLVNGGGLRNQGFEMSWRLQSRPTDVQWHSAIHVGINSNEILALPTANQMLVESPISDVAHWHMLQVGESIGAFYGFKSDGLVGEGENTLGINGKPLQTGAQKYQDLNGDGLISGSDRTIIGKSLPDANVGLSAGLKYRGFDCSFLLQGLLGRDVADANLLYLNDPSGRSNVLADFAKGGDEVAVPNLLQTERVFSDQILQDGSYLRLQQVRVGYTFTNTFLEGLPFSALQVYLIGNNLFTITGYRGIDPDVSHYGQDPLRQGIDFDNYPKAKVISVGLKIKF